MEPINGHAGGNVPDGETIPEAVSRDPVFRRLVRNIQRFRNSGRLSDDDALASIAELVNVAVEAAFTTKGVKPPVDLNEFETDDEAERALNIYVADIYAALGEHGAARLYLENRAEFERRRKAGTSLEKSVLA